MVEVRQKNRKRAVRGMSEDAGFLVPGRGFRLWCDHIRAPPTAAAARLQAAALAPVARSQLPPLSHTIIEQPHP